MKYLLPLYNLILFNKQSCILVSESIDIIIYFKFKFVFPIIGKLYKFKTLPLFSRHIMTGSYNNFFRMFDRESKRDVTLEASRENTKPRTILKSRKVCTGGKRKKDEISVDCLDFNKKILHTAWHPSENIIAVAATNNLYLFQSKD